MQTITLQQLSTLDACEEQLEKFKEFFGESVTLSLELVKYAKDFEWDWAADHLLTKAAWNEYIRIIDAAWTEYLRIRDAAWAEYERVTAPAWAEYKRVRAKTFLRLAMKENYEQP